MRAPALRYVETEGARLAVWDWPGDGAPLIFAHATGFHGRCWDQIVHQFPGRRAVAIDARGHGRSSKPDPPYPWRLFGRDLAAVAEKLGIEGAIGVGHSMGGHSIVACAIERPATFSGMVLLDPTIFPKDYYGARRRHDASFIGRRRAVWQSVDEMFERFHKRPPFDLWRPEILRDYCEFGLLAEDGHLVLACPPSIEASIYENSSAPASDLHPWLSSVEAPATVMRGGREWRMDVFDLTASPTAPDLAAELPRGRDLLLEGRSHYIPMEAPEVVVEEIRRMAG